MSHSWSEAKVLLNSDKSVMGVAHSIPRRGGLTKPPEFKLESNHLHAADAYFQMSFKGAKIQVVNAKISELHLICVIIKRHAKILSEGWVQNMTYSFRVPSGRRHCMIQLVADTLVTLYQMWG